MNYRESKHEPVELIKQAGEYLECPEKYIEWYSWPETFGSTSGPHGGIGGQTMTSFQVFGFRGPDGAMLCYAVQVNGRHGDILTK